MKATDLSPKGSSTRMVLAIVNLILWVIKLILETPIIWKRIIDNPKTHSWIDFAFTLLILVYTIFFCIVMYVVYKAKYNIH